MAWTTFYVRLKHMLLSELCCIPHRQTVHHFLSAQSVAALHFLFHSQLQFWTSLFPHVHAPYACWQSMQGLSSVKISASSCDTDSNLASNA